MAYSDDLIGRYVTLKAVTKNDAEFILSIRNDERFRGRIPKIHCSLEEQNKWILMQRSLPEDYYYIIWSKSGQRLGTIGAYRNEEDRFETGRIVSYGDARENMGAILLLYDYVFYQLDKEYISGYCLAENKNMINLNKRLGMVFSKDTIDHNGERIIQGIILKKDYLQCTIKIRKLLGWGK